MLGDETLGHAFIVLGQSGLLKPYAATDPDQLTPRVREQRKLPLEEHVHELAPGERCCASCGREMVEWNGEHEEVEEVDVVRRLFVLKKHAQEVPLPLRRQSQARAWSAEAARWRPVLARLRDRGRWPVGPARTAYKLARP
ncbi:MAG: hypothetical protein JWN04_2809, partial [Myxococcaceae bacterium]|nr:hypothetical protein [Myxococcaceae bacterium]